MLIFNFTTKSPKILKGISKFILIVEDFNKNNRLLTRMKPLPLEFFKSVAFFLGHPVVVARTSLAVLENLTWPRPSDSRKTWETPFLLHHRSFS